MSESTLKISTVVDKDPIIVPYNPSTTTSEDVCIIVCKQLNVGTIARHLFALRISGKPIFLPASSYFVDKNQDYELRIRFKTANINRLKEIDPKAYDYYFHQARLDILHNKIPDIEYERYRRELVGLGITDMYREMLEKNLSRESVQRDYKKYIPKEVLEHHRFFIRRPIYNTLRQLTNTRLSAKYVTSEYLKQLDMIAPEYLSETFKAMTDLDGTIWGIQVKVSPFHQTEPGVRYCLESKKDKWIRICTIEDLCFVSIRYDGTVEISRRNGIPFYLKFSSNPVMYSFISLLDGYYRLTCKWTFNLCKDVPTPSLQKLQAMKCHGPVGGAFSYSKLEEKRQNRPGCFIIRESDSKYNDYYYIDVCTKDSLKPSTFNLERLPGQEFIFNSDPNRYQNIRQLMAAYNDPDGAIYLHECIPPSEYDKSPLLLCQSEDLSGEALTDFSSLSSIIPTSPLCINSKDLQVYKGTYCYVMLTTPEFKIEKKHCQLRKCKSEDCKMAGTGNDYIGSLTTTRSNRSCDYWFTNVTTHHHDPNYHNTTLFADLGLPDTKNLCRNPSRDITGQKKEGSRGLTIVYRAMWKATKGKKIEVAMKMLKHEAQDNFLKELLELAGKYAFLQSNAIVRLYGITLTGNVSLIQEYFRLGPLDQYLRENKNLIEEVDLIEAASNVASALWHLKENDIVHGNIRCRNLMVNTHDTNSFTVKLTDPGINVTFATTEVHWIPVECYANVEYAKHSTAADVWAFATTLWEMFMYGEELKTDDHSVAMRSYALGNRLRQPPACPKSIYAVMSECWDADPYKRKQPQAVTRDINQILYQEFNSRRTHSYAKPFTKSTSEMSYLANSSTQSLISSTATDTTFMPYASDLVALNEIGELSDTSRNFVGPSGGFISSTGDLDLDDGLSCDFSNMMPHFDFSTTSTSLDSINSFQSVLELDSCNVVLQGRIGQGFYGEVFKGTLMYSDDDKEPMQVAVKKLKATTSQSRIEDLERESNIMKSLRHPNIVQILGVLEQSDFSIIMEFVPHGSLQSYLKIHKESLRTKQLLKYALDIAKGMDYLGKNKIVHRDLATRNILVVDEDHVKISDFGLAQVIPSSGYYFLTTNRELPIKWYAPESLREGKFSVRSDVWSYGVTLCETFNYGEEPVLPPMTPSSAVAKDPGDPTRGGQEQENFLRALELGLRFPCPPKCKQFIYIRIIYPCWHKDSNERPHFSQLVSETEELLTQYN